MFGSELWCILRAGPTDCGFTQLFYTTLNKQRDKYKQAEIIHDEAADNKTSWGGQTVTVLISSCVDCSYLLACGTKV